MNVNTKELERVKRLVEEAKLMAKEYYWRQPPRRLEAAIDMLSSELLLGATQHTEAELHERRGRLEELKKQNARYKQQMRAAARRIAKAKARSKR